jgi:hypothetical protein
MEEVLVEVIVPIVIGAAKEPAAFESSAIN